MNYRNIKNTSRRDYNCGGYALGTFNWYCPYNREEDSAFSRCSFLEEDIETVVRDMTDFIIKEFNGYVREIYNISELTEGENAVAFRIGNDDFHFMLRQSNGHWYHKCGGSLIKSILKEKVFNNDWTNTNGTIVYYSPIILLAVQREAIINEQENF